jgi:GDP-mannose 6-dehydrogenase
MKSNQRSISIFGLGYVGSVMAACLAREGNRVIGVDVNQAKVQMLNSGHSPIIEARMDELVSKAHESCRLHAMTDVSAAVDQTEPSLTLLTSTNPAGPAQHLPMRGCAGSLAPR